MVHTLRLDNYFPTPRKLVLGTNSSFGTESIQIERGAGWDGLALTATWHIPGREEPLRVALLDGDAMDVPPEVTKEAKDGVLVLAGLASGVQRASCNVEYLILEQAGVYGGQDAEPTPELAAQVLAAALQAKADAEAAAQEAAEAKARAEEAQAASAAAKEAAEAAAADAAKAGPYAEAALAAQLAAEAAQAAAAAAKADAVKAQTAAQAAAKTAQDAQSAAEKARDDAQTARQGAEDARDAAAGSAAAAAKSEANAKKSADTLAESVENVAANTAAVAELREKKAEIDDTAVGADGWSSKHIVDMLCPKIEESGNPVQCYPVAGYPLGVKAKWEPMQEGTGTPSPENIRPIKGRASVRVERCGKNLWSLGNVGFRQYKEISTNYPAGKYVLSYEIETESTDDNIQVGWFIDGEWKYLHKQKDERIIIVMSASVGISGFRFYAGSSPTDQSNATYKNIQLEIGDSATTYTPYIGQTNTLTLPETTYGGSVDAVSGRGERARRMLSLDGTEKWFTWGVNANNAAVTGFFTYDIADYKVENEKGICSHLPHPSGGTWGGRNEGIGFASVGSSRYLMCCVKTKILDDVSSDAIAITSWKAYLAAQYAAGTPVQVCYKLATPVPFTATGGAALPALAGVNTVLTDADSVEVTGRADPIKRIEDLEAAVASIN